MANEYPNSWSTLEQPWWRLELLAYLEELATTDPRRLWEDEQRRGLISGIDQVFHFLFDDHEFDEGDIGYTLFDTDEAAAVGTVKSALNDLLVDLPNGDNDEYVQHPGWKVVTSAAASALARMTSR